MSQQTSDRGSRQQGQASTQSEPAFKPVALPALAAAVRAAKQQPKRAKTAELPAILRKDAALD